MKINKKNIVPILNSTTVENKEQLISFYLIKTKTFNQPVLQIFYRFFGFVITKNSILIYFRSENGFTAYRTAILLTFMYNKEFHEFCESLVPADCKSDMILFHFLLNRERNPTKK